MKRYFIAVLLSIFLPYGISNAQVILGSYSAYVDGEAVTLNLVQETEDKVTGIINMEGVEYTIEGKRNGDHIEGFMNALDETFGFTALITNDSLALTLFDPEDDKNLSNDSSETLLLRRMQNEATARINETLTSGNTRSIEVEGDGDVVINGILLTEEQISELEKTYNGKPLPGKYWYDTRSGLYGVVGFPAFGFMLPGHSYGTLGRNASNGNTGIYVNGRELPETEWLIWSQLLGYLIQPGRYWLDGNGNAGFEGSSVSTENLYVAAGRNAYRGSGSGGDNFWSSRFSAGNYDSGNQRGYVSVPGHGPVGYGF